MRKDGIMANLYKNLLIRLSRERSIELASNVSFSNFIIWCLQINSKNKKIKSSVREKSFNSFIVSSDDSLANKMSTKCERKSKLFDNFLIY